VTIHLQTTAADSMRNVFVDTAIQELRFINHRDHRLLIISCYIDFLAIRDLILRLKNQIDRLKEVSLAFEYYEAFRSRRPNETLKELDNLERWCKNRDIAFDWRAIRVGALMHAKSYALVQTSVKTSPNGVGDSIVYVGSGNATFPGLGRNALHGDQRTNVELFQISINSSSDIDQFLNIWDHLCQFEQDLNAPALKADDYEFSYTFLASGVFLHDWRESLSSKIGVKYKLTPEGQKLIALDVALKRLGFDINKATMAHNPLERVDFTLIRSMPQGFTRRYTVDSLLGRWCPISVWRIVEDTIERDDSFNIFYKTFLDATEPDKLEEYAKKEEMISTQLVERGIVTEVVDRIDSWVEKINTLRGDEARLKRIFLRLESFDLPYDFSARNEVTVLYESLSDTLDLRNNMSFIAHKIADANSARNLTLLELNAQEKDELVNLIQSAGQVILATAPDDSTLPDQM